MNRSKIFPHCFHILVNLSIQKSKRYGENTQSQRQTYVGREGQELYINILDHDVEESTDKNTSSSIGSKILDRLFDRFEVFLWYELRVTHENHGQVLWGDLIDHLHHLRVHFICVRNFCSLGWLSHVIISTNFIFNLIEMLCSIIFLFDIIKMTLQ